MKWSLPLTLGIMTCSETFIHTPSFDAFVFPHGNQKSIFFLASNLSTYFLSISIHTLPPFFLCSIYQTGNCVFSLDNFLTWKTAAATKVTVLMILGKYIRLCSVFNFKSFLYLYNKYFSLWQIVILSMASGKKALRCSSEVRVATSEHRESAWAIEASRLRCQCSLWIALILWSRNRNHVPWILKLCPNKCVM